MYPTQVFVCLWKGCKVYNTPSTSQSWLQRHMLTHSGDKPFKVNTHARITVQSVMSQSICSPPGLHVIQSAWNRSASCELTVNGVCSCSVWWGAVTPRLPLRAGWPVTSPLTSAHRVHPKCPIRAKSRRSLHPRPASTRGGNWRTNKDARYVCTNSHIPLCPDSFTLFHLRRKHTLKKWRTDKFV